MNLSLELTISTLKIGFMLVPIMKFFMWSIKKLFSLA